MYKTIGILGGLSPESTIIYYRYLVEEYTRRFHDYGFPQVIIFSATFQRYIEWQEKGEWDKAAQDMINKMNSLEKAGADFALIASNTMHIVFDAVQKAVRLPMLNIVDVTAEAINKENIGKVALLGTKFTMSEPFYQQHLNALGINVITPPSHEQEKINHIIFTELCKGIIQKPSKNYLIELAYSLKEKGAHGLICGCTEIPLLLQEDDAPLKIFNTTLLHAEKALQLALQ